MRVGGNNHCILSTIPEGIVCAKIITGITASIYIVTIVGLELCTLCLTSEIFHLYSNHCWTGTVHAVPD